MAVLVAFSGGLESTYLIYRTLLKGSEVIPAYINVTGNNPRQKAEFIVRDKLLVKFKKEFGDLIRSPIYCMINAIKSSYMESKDQTVLKHNVNQQINTALGLMHCRKELIDFDPTPVVGWLQEDSKEYALESFHYTEAEYENLLKLPKVIGKVSGLDGTGSDLLAPLWDMSKLEIWNSLPVEYRDAIIYNGQDGDMISDDPNETKFTFTVSPLKINEYRDIGVNIQKDHTFDIRDMSRLSRIASGCILPGDIPGLPEQLETNTELLRLMIWGTRSYRNQLTVAFQSLKLSENGIIQEVNANYWAFGNHFDLHTLDNDRNSKKFISENVPK